jgi:hypothetical protein
LTQISKKLKILDKKKLLEEQNKQRKKYGLQPHKRLDADYLYHKKITKPQTKKELQRDDTWRAYQ